MSFLILIGIDSDIYKQCKKRERNIFITFHSLMAVLSLIVGLAFIYILNIIFDNLIVALFVGAFFSFVFFNLYKFILYLITYRRSNEGITRRSLIIPHAFKVLIIAFFATLTSLPILLFGYRAYINEKLPEIHRNKLNEVRAELDGVFKTQTADLEKKISVLDNQISAIENLISDQEIKLTNSNSEDVKNEIRKTLKILEKELAQLKKSNIPLIELYQDNLSAIKKEKETQIAQYKRIIYGSHFIIDRFKVLFERKTNQKYILIVLIIFVFLLPVIFKLSAVKSDKYSYEKIKTLSDKRDIINNYFNFKRAYSKMVFESTGEYVEYPEFYDDPPFNTIKKEDNRIVENKGKFSEYLEQKHTDY